MSVDEHRFGLSRRRLLRSVLAGLAAARFVRGSSSEAAVAPPHSPVVIAQGVDPTTLDPQFEESGALANVEDEMFDYLISYDRDMKIVPDLAESYRLLPDRVTWQLKIRTGVTFWNGEKIDARAVKFTYDRIGDQSLRTQGLNDAYYPRVGFDHISVVDDYTVNFVMKKPTILFPVYTTFDPILAPDYYTKQSAQETAIKPMGSGPWMFKEWVKDDHLTMVANPTYWRGKPQIDTLIFKAVPDPATRVAMLEAGEADLIADLAPEDVARINANKALRVSKAVGGRRINISIPTQSPMFADRGVRQALNLAVDFDAINKTLLDGVAYGRMTGPTIGEAWVDPSIKPYPHDPDKARALLKKAGWNSSTAVTINTSNGRYLKDKELAEAVAGDLQKVGMNAQAQTYEWSVYSDRLRHSQFDMPYLVGYGSRFYGPDDLSILFAPGFEGFEWADHTTNGPEATKLMNQLLGTFDEKQQQQLAWKISRLFVEEAPWIFLWNQVALLGVNRRIDYTATGNGQINFWRPAERDARFTG